MVERRKLRSQAWFGGNAKNAFMHRSWMKNQGMPPDSFDGRPVIGICNTWSELTPCNAHLRSLAERVKRGVLEAGGFPVEFPVMSLGESNMRPTAMLYRNLASMDVEESLRANPIDAISVRRAVEQLNDDQRGAVALVLVEGLTYKEAAEVLDVPIGTVTSRIARAREQLQTLLSAHSPTAAGVAR